MVNFGGTVRLNPLGIALICGIIILLIIFNSGGEKKPVAVNVTNNKEEVSLKRLLSVAIDVAQQGGSEVARIRKLADIGESSKGKTLEGANDPKTEGDMASHKVMYWGIKKAFPHINVISEEHDVISEDLSKIQTPSYTNSEVDSIVTTDISVPADQISVWIDPLDATQEYTEKLLEYVTTMVCVAINGKPVIGVIHKPFNDGGTAWGWAGPDFKSRSIIKDSAANTQSSIDISKSRIIVSRSHAGEVNSTAQTALGPEISVTPAGGAGFKTWEVIKGTQDAYVHTTLIKKWDICAGNAILTSLGGQLTTLAGQEIDYEGRGEGDEKNKGGVLATMHNHQEFVDKLSGLAGS
jgi:inositol monophosphatase 3